MKTFERLNKNEMKMIVGGVDREISEEGGDNCTSNCTSDADCSSGKKCQAFRTTCPTPLVGICG